MVGLYNQVALLWPTPPWHTPPTPPLHDPPHPYMTHPTPSLHGPPHPCMTHPTPIWPTPPLVHFWAQRSLFSWAASLSLPFGRQLKTAVPFCWWCRNSPVEWSLVWLVHSGLRLIWPLDNWASCFIRPNSSTYFEAELSGPMLRGPLIGPNSSTYFEVN